MYDVSAVILILASLLVLYRVIRGPRSHDRLLGVNMIGTNTVVLLALIGFIYERPHFLDLALVYALINFIATIALLRYRETGGVDR